jgi:hypothetical protein
MWGYAQLAEQLPDSLVAWRNLSEKVEWALGEAPEIHWDNLIALRDVVDGQLPENWMSMDRAAEVLTERTGVPVTRGHVADGLKAFIVGTGRQFDPEQYVKFAPFEQVEGENVFLTSFNLTDLDDGSSCFSTTVRMIHAGGVDAEGGEPVSVTQVEFRDVSNGSVRFLAPGNTTPVI